jgi:hypothetical protein
LETDLVAEGFKLADVVALAALSVAIYCIRAKA